MPAKLIVKTTDAMIREMREAAAQRVVDSFGNQLPDRRLLCFFDDEEWQTFKES